MIRADAASETHILCFKVKSTYSAIQFVYLSRVELACQCVRAGVHLHGGYDEGEWRLGRWDWCYRRAPAGGAGGQWRAL
jgi:hypothetical protein